MSAALYGWDLAEYVAETYAERNMLCLVSIVRKGSPTLNVQTGMLQPTNDTAVYEGKARVSEIQGPMTLGVGDEPQYFSSAMVYIPANTDVLPQVDDVVTVTAGRDAVIIGRSYRVTDVQSGGQFDASRALQCTGIQPARNAL